MKNARLLQLTLFCLALLFVRVVHTQTFLFCFLVWNLFLAWLPLFFCRKAEHAPNRYIKALLIILTILFLPNSPYLVTDLFHLKKSLTAPLWMDVLLILSFAIVGLVFFLITVKRLLIMATRQYRMIRPHRWVKGPLMVLTSYGIYLGRYLRFNSWDVVTNPAELFSDLCNSIFNSSHNRETLAITLTFSVFLFLIYEVYDSLRSADSETYPE